MPVYSFQDHQRQENTTSIYSPHVLVLEGIYALYDPRILEMLDLKIFAEADADLCLARRSMFAELPLLYVRELTADAKSKQVTRDVRTRGRDIEGCIKQWFAFVKPNFQRHVEPQRHNAGAYRNLYVPAGLIHV